VADFRVEREVVIEAPIDVVWRTITEPDQISQWFADRVALELEPGGNGHLGFGEKGGGPIVVEVVEEPTFFSYRWNHPEGETAIDGNSMLVAFTLRPEGPERTTLHVVESGHELRGWPEAEVDRYAQEHGGGWATHLGRLAQLFPRPNR
jgi:uncharacterized protein YndB with AHSA1/START domain